MQTLWLHSIKTAAVSLLYKHPTACNPLPGVLRAPAMFELYLLWCSVLCPTDLLYTTQLPGRFGTSKLLLTALYICVAFFCLSCALHFMPRLQMPLCPSPAVSPSSSPPPCRSQKLLTSHLVFRRLSRLPQLCCYQCWHWRRA